MDTGLLTFDRPAKDRNIVNKFAGTVLIALLLICGIGAKAQVASYNYATSSYLSACSDPTAQYVAIGGTQIFPLVATPTTWDNENAVSVPLGFTFTYNSVNYTNCFVSPNGFITFGSGALGTDFTPISGSGSYAGAIAAYGRDMIINGTTTKVTYTSTGGVFTVQWVGLRKNGASGLAGTMNMQIKLYQTTNVIEIYQKALPQTGATAFAITNAIYGEIGLRGSNNTDVNDLNWQPATLPNNWPSCPGFANITTIGKVLTKGNTAATTASIVYDTKFVWTPNGCSAPSALTVPPLTLTYNSVVVNYTEPSTAPTLPYEYEIRTSGAGGSGATGLTTSGNIPVGTGTSGVVGGLTGGTTYTFYIRSECSAGNYSAWVGVTFTTKCAPVNVPWSENFNASAPPAIPACEYTEVLTTYVATPGSEAGIWVTANPTAPAWGFFDKHLRIKEYNGNGAPNNATYFTKALNLTGGQSYRLQYTYGASSELPTTQQNLIVRYGTAPYESAMMPTVPPATSTDPTLMTAADRLLALANHEAIKGGPFTNVINFTPASTDVYYIGFTDYSAENNATTLLDDIQITLTTCFAPTITTTTAITSGSATIHWTAPASPPGSGYLYYVSTSNTAPDNSTTPTGSVAAGVLQATLTGLSPLTTYYVWVRSNCGSGDNSAWSLLSNGGLGTNPIDKFTTAAGTSPASCNPSGAGYSQDPNGITNVTVGTVNNTTGIEANNYGDYTSLGPAYVGQGTTATVYVTYRTGYTYYTNIWVDWNNDGDFVDAGEAVSTGSQSTAAVPTTLALTFTVTGSLGQHRMRIGGIDDPIFSGGALTPCRTGAYQAYEDYSIYVTLAPPALTLSSYSANLCENIGTAVNITSTLGNYTSYTWSPTTGITGSAPSYTLNPSTTTIYTLTAFNSSTFQTTTATFTYNVKPAPSAVTATPSTATVCQTTGPAVLLSASGGTISGITIYNENFNGTAPGWTNTTNQSLGAWALQPDGYAPFFTNISSNDNSQFYFTESDAPGPGTTTNTTLTSPAISLVGYSSATLDFWHFYKFYSNFNGPENGIVNVGPSSTGPWTQLSIYNTGNVGTETGWVHATGLVIPPALLGGNIYIQFKYDATYDWGWGIDNLTITGSGPSTLSWYNTTAGNYAGLYTDAAATTAYTGTASTTVYALPSATTNIYATASGAGCSTASNPVAITVTPNSAGTVAPSSLTSCNGYATDLVLSGYTGSSSIVKWQYANNAAMTGATDIPSSNSATLTSTQITAACGILTSNTYFRAVVSGCGTVYSPVVAITVSSTTWNGGWTNGTPTFSKMAIFTANYTVTANTTACSIYVKSGAIVTVNGGVYLQSNNGVNVDDASGSRLIFLNNSNLYQNNVAPNGPSNSNVGDITFYKSSTPMRPFDYTYWSSPVDLQIPAVFSPMTQPDKYYTWNTTAYQWSQFVNPGINPMPVGKGMIIRAPNNNPASPTAYPGLFGYIGTGAHGGGVPNTGIITVTTKRNSATNKKDLLGNPYPSGLNATTFVSGNATAFGSGTTLYFWTHNTAIASQSYTSNDLASWNYTGGVGTAAANSGSGNNSAPNGFIGAGQGFLADINSAVGATVPVTYTNAMRTPINGNFFRPGDVQAGVQSDEATLAIESLERNRVWLELTNDQGGYKQTLVGYIENATNDYEDGFDGEVFEGGYPIGFYSILGDKKLTSQGRALPFDISDEVPLGYKVPEPGTFTIGLTDFDGLFGENDIYLEDKLLNVINNLKNGSYTFVTDAGSFEDRFILRYTNTALGVNSVSASAHDVVVYKNNDAIVVETSNLTMATVKVFDIRGREVRIDADVNSKKHEIRNLNIAQQVLLIQVTSTDGAIVTKKVIY